VGLIEAFKNLYFTSGIGEIINTFLDGGYKTVIMLVLACVLLYLAIVKKYEPLLLLPIAFGMLLANLPLANLVAVKVLEEGMEPGLMYYLYRGVAYEIFPPLIFLGIGCMTDFGPLIANPKSLLLGAAAQVGIFGTYVGARLLDASGLFSFTQLEAAAIAIIGGADGPTAIYTAGKLAEHLVPTIAIAAYSYMALVPVIQPPIMRALTTKKERSVVMTQLRTVSKTEKIIFPIAVTIFVALILPSAATLVGMLMLGNLIKESGVCERLCKTASNELMNIITIMLGVSVGATATAEKFLDLKTIGIMILGVCAFALSTAFGVLFGKVMYWISGGKINPLIGAAGVSAVPMAARIAQKVGREENPNNYLLMHAMGPNVAGVIGSSLASGIFISMLGSLVG
jgi:oxaloacetate decarboxylase beta subunit